MDDAKEARDRCSGMEIDGVRVVSEYVRFPAWSCVSANFDFMCCLLPLTATNSRGLFDHQEASHADSWRVHGTTSPLISKMHFEDLRLRYFSFFPDVS